jgi:arginyl-tRNA synthetase
MSAGGPLGELERLLADAATGIAGEAVEVELERPGDTTHGDYATSVALQLAKRVGRPPRELAGELASAVEDSALLAAAPEIAGPGFVNLRVSDAWYRGALEAMLEAGDGYGSGSASAPERVQVELVSANPTGPLTVGSARNGAYGDAVARLLEFAGHTVEREYYYNDAGSQMEHFRASVEARRRGEEPPEDGYHGDYIAALAELDGDPVSAMLERIEDTLERFRIGIDSWERQSVLERDIPSMLESLDTYEADGAVWIRSTEFGDEKDRVLVRSEARGGLPTYEAADAVYMGKKFARGFDRLFYILGADHHGYVSWLQALAQASGREREAVEVLIYQLVHLTDQGEAKKVSKRRGDVVLLDELLDEIGVDAARWYLVMRGHDQTIDIDVELAAEKTNKNPVYYVQYVHARTAGIFREADEAPIDATPYEDASDEERDLIKRLVEFPRIVAEATERRGPHAITVYAVRLADEFHRFYHHSKVLQKHFEEVTSAQQAFRLALCRATQETIARCLALVGVAAPERM